MNDRKGFSSQISQLDLERVEQALALLWFYRTTQTFEDRTASELSEDLWEDGLGKPNVTRLHSALNKSRKAVKGRRARSFQLHAKYVPQLKAKYAPFLNIKEADTSSSLIPSDFVEGTPHLEQLVNQINGCYNYGLYDGSAVLIRRLIESLIIEAFIKNGLVTDIRPNNTFLPLDRLINKISGHPIILLNRNAAGYLGDIKELGDTAAHDRTYLTIKDDIDDLKLKIRKTVKELLTVAKLRPSP